MAAVDVEDLVVRYEDLVAVDTVSFSVARGEVVTLLGPNGAGKTSTVETIEGYRRPDAGSVRVVGLDPIADRNALMPRIGAMLQVGGVYPGIRVIEMLRLYASFYADSEDVTGLLERLGLAKRAKSMWRQLSGGEQQRLSLALALIGRPDVAFLDEPTAGVDVTGRQLVRQLVRDLADRGVAVLLTTHDLAEAERVADRVVIIDHGRVVATGTPAELMTREGVEEIRFGAPTGLDVVALGTTLSATVVEESPGEYRADLPPSPTNVARITSWLAERDLPLADLHAGRRRLEDIFISLTTAGEADEAEHDGAEIPSGRRSRGKRDARRSKGRTNR